MKSNKSKSRFGSAAVIYLIALLLVVLLYLGAAYPKLTEKINTLNTQIQSLRTEINLLNPYVSQLSSLNEKSEKAENEYAQNTELDEPVMFSNILYECADKANVRVTNIYISTNEPVEITGKYESENLSGSISISADDNRQIEYFISLLEQNEGSAMCVNTLSYGKGENSVQATASIIMYTVKK